MATIRYTAVGAVILWRRPANGIQRPVDHRFNRAARCDEEVALATFTAGLRDEVDVDRVLEAMRHIAERSVEPTAAAVWQRGRGPAS